jgi:hypothetical protein
MTESVNSVVSKSKQEKSAKKSDKKSVNKSEGSTPALSDDDDEYGLEKLCAAAIKRSEENQKTWKDKEEEVEVLMDNGVHIHPLFAAKYGSSNK